MTAWSVMLRGIRYRPGRSLGVFLLALVATTAAVLAPAYSRAAQQSVLTDGLRSAPADATSLVGSRRCGIPTGETQTVSRGFSRTSAPVAPAWSR